MEKDEVNTQEEENNLEESEKVMEEHTDLAAELAKDEAMQRLEEENQIPEGYREATEEEIKEMRAFSEMFKGKSPITVMMELNERIVLLEKKVF